MFVLFLATTFCFAQDKNEKSVTHYVFPDFVSGKVKYKSGVATSTKLNYNSILQEMIYSEKGKLMALAYLDLIDTVFLEQRIFIPVEKAFYEVLAKGDVSLYAQYTCNIIPPGQPAAYGGTSQTSAVTNYSSINSGGQLYELKLPDDYKLSPGCLYWINKNGTFYRASNVNQFSKVFPEKADAIKNWAKKNKVDIRNKEDIMKLFGFCLSPE